MSLAQAATRPPKCLLINVHSGAEIEPLFNPTQVSDVVQVRYNRHQVPGLSHEVLQYRGTSNRRLSGVEFYLDRLFAEAQPGAPDIRAFRSFMRALTVPPEHIEGGLPEPPPKLLFIWPEVAVLHAVVTDLEFQYRQFNAYAELMVFTARCTLESFEIERLTSERFAREI